MNHFDNKKAIGGSSYLIRIQRTENHTWQGTIQWLEGNKTLHFRSFLELIYLLQEAQQILPSSKQEKFRSWFANNALKLFSPE